MVMTRALLRTGLAAALLLAAPPARGARVTLSSAVGCDPAPGEADFRLDYAGGPLEVRLRRRGTELLGGVAGRLLQHGCIMAGRIEAGWGVGSLLCDAADLALAVPRRQAPLRLRLTTSWRAVPRRGLAGILTRGSCQVGAWALEDQSGVGVSWGSWSLAALRRAAGFWDWSAGYRPAGIAGTQSSLALEVAGPLGATRPADDIWDREAARGNGVGSVAGVWGIELAPLPGDLRGIFRWYGNREARGGERELPHEGWLIDWHLPGLRGMQPALILSSERRTGRSTPVPVIKRRAEMTLSAEPWPGADIRVRCAVQRQVECRGDPWEPGQRALVSTSRSIFELGLQVQISTALRWTLRMREGSGEIWLGQEETPEGLALRAPSGAVAEAWVDDAGEASAGPRGASRAVGDFLRAQLRWQAGRRWQAGAAIAATPGQGSGGAMLPVRLPPGRILWHAMGAGYWFAEAYVARLGAAWRVEAACRFLAGRQPRTPRVTLLCGVRRRFDL